MGRSEYNSFQIRFGGTELFIQFVSNRFKGISNRINWFRYEENSFQLEENSYHIKPNSVWSKENSRLTIKIRFLLIDR